MGAVLNEILFFGMNTFSVCTFVFLMVARSLESCDGDTLSGFSSLCLALTRIPPLTLSRFFTILCDGCVEVGCSDGGGWIDGGDSNAGGNGGGGGDGGNGGNGLVVFFFCLFLV